jgi:hypothetical protein
MQQLQIETYFLFSSVLSVGNCDPAVLPHEPSRFFEKNF